MTNDILERLKNSSKINGAYPRDIEDAIKEIERLRTSAWHKSWEGDVDRMSGAFTQEEIDNATAWR